MRVQRVHAFLFSGLAGASLAVSACKPKQGASTTKAITFDGTHALALVPTRLKVSPSKTLSGHQATLWDNALKASISLVVCEGSDATATVNELEALVSGAQNALLGLDRVKRSGADLFVYDPDHGTTTPAAAAMKSSSQCYSAGNLGMGAVLALLGDSVTNYKDPVKQQQLVNSQAFFWMAMRGPYQANNVGFTGVYYRLLAESIGFYPDGNELDQQTHIAAMDSMLNPCAAGVPAAFKAFKDAVPLSCSAPPAQCQTTACNYNVKDSKTQTFQSFISGVIANVDQVNATYWKTLSGTTGTDRLSIDGIDLSWSPTATESQLKARVSTSSSKRVSGSGSCPSVDPTQVVAVTAQPLSRSLSTLKNMLAVHVAPYPGNTVSAFSGFAAVAPPVGSETSPAFQGGGWFAIPEDAGRCYAVKSAPVTGERIIYVAQPTADGFFQYGMFYPILDAKDLKLLEGVSTLNPSKAAMGLADDGEGAATSLTFNGVTVPLSGGADGLGLTGATKTRGFIFGGDGSGNIFNKMGRAVFGPSDYFATYGVMPGWPGNVANAYYPSQQYGNGGFYPTQQQMGYYNQPGAIGGQYFGQTGSTMFAQGGAGYSMGYPGGSYGMPMQGFNQVGAYRNMTGGYPPGPQPGTYWGGADINGDGRPDTLFSFNQRYALQWPSPTGGTCTNAAGGAAGMGYCGGGQPSYVAGLGQNVGRLPAYQPGAFGVPRNATAYAGSVLACNCGAQRYALALGDAALADPAGGGGDAVDPTATAASCPNATSPSGGVSGGGVSGGGVSGNSSTGTVGSPGASSGATPGGTGGVGAPAVSTPSATPGDPGAVAPVTGLPSGPSSSGGDSPPAPTPIVAPATDSGSSG